MSIDQEKYKNLGFNKYLIGHLANYRSEHVLGYRCEPPYNILGSPLSGRNIFPLWERGITAVYFNYDSKKFEVCSLEDIDDIWLSVDSAQGILAYLLLQLMEDEHSDQEISLVGKLIGFTYINELLKGANQAEDYCSWSEGFPQQCS
ncbi:hypothetical protein M0G74_17025 [Microbulbifer sp. CAU 1566]|uniref:hypothetical protein n=1 Tax=Microbulbifer sp. CAU 1566 TaxID=2933269 RepID=UPI002002F4A9|nr:hypothetical protein [Microbulbifer sp. CAU 1566]MCK7598979.1 hypothetical protein [Microbulbifer sp. CAU 1566]